MSPDALVLASLLEVGAGGAEEGELARRAGLGVPDLRRRMRSLVRNGFGIGERDPGRWRLHRRPGRLIAALIAARLGPGRVVGSSIRVLEETGSTNEAVLRWSRSRAQEGTVALAELQTQGRGRMGRRWESPRGRSLLLSVLLHPPGPPARHTRLTMMGAVALARTLEGLTGIPPAIKWPNDILSGGRKLAGILAEAHLGPDRPSPVALGMGLNVNQSEEDLPFHLRHLATSMRMCAGRGWNRNEVAARLLSELDGLYTGLLQGLYPALHREWCRRCDTLGRTVTVLQGSRRLVGMAEALHEDGSLLLRTREGSLHTLHSGEASLGS